MLHLGAPAANLFGRFPFTKGEGGYARKVKSLPPLTRILLAAYLQAESITKYGHVWVGSLATTVT